MRRIFLPRSPLKKLRYSVPLMLGLLCTHVLAEAPQGFTYSEVQGCSSTKDAYRSADTITARKRKNLQTVIVEVSLNCSARLKVSVEYGQPEYTSIAIDEEFTPGKPIAGCSCMRTIEVTLTEKVRRGSAIYLVKRGVARAHASAA